MRTSATDRFRAATCWIVALSIASVAACPTRSQAQPTSAAISGAQVLVGEGRKLRAAGDMQGARERFESAYLLVRTPIIGLDLGKAREALGLLIEARAVLLEASALPPFPNESDESKGARAEAVRIANDLEGRIPTLALSCKGVEPGVRPSVTLDGDPLDDEALGAPRKVNPGKHVVVVRARDREQRAEVELAEKDAKTVSIVFPPLPPPPKPIAPKLPPPRPRPLSPLTWVGFSVAGAGLIAGTVTGIIALRKAHDFTTSCEGYDYRCPPSLRDGYDSSRLYGNVSTAAFILAGAGIGVGVYGLLSREASPSTASPGQVSVAVSVSGVSLRGVF